MISGDHNGGTSDDVRERSDAIRAVYNEYLAGDAADSTRSETSTQTAGGATPSLADSEWLANARTPVNGEKFLRLFGGDTCGYECHSEADRTLCSLLAFWTGGDTRQIDRQFRDSGLIREKWDSRHERILRALVIVATGYSDTDATGVDS